MEDQCCNGHCNQGRDCPHHPARENSYWMQDLANLSVAIFFASLSVACGILVLYLFVLVVK